MWAMCIFLWAVCWQKMVKGRYPPVALIPRNLTDLVPAQSDHRHVWERVTTGYNGCGGRVQCCRDSSNDTFKSHHGTAGFQIQVIK